MAASSADKGFLYKEIPDIGTMYMYYDEDYEELTLRIIVDEENLTDLIIVDGGLTQINATKEVINKLNLADRIKICGLKKDKNHRTNALIDGDSLDVIPIEKNSDLFNFLTYMQDEVHRFTITYHRQIRSKGLINSFLDDIVGIGDKRKKILLKKFGSVSKMKEASIDDLSEILPQDIAKSLYEKLHK